NVMVGEDSFVVCKDGRYGILIEAEYLSAESDRVEQGPESVLKPYKEVVDALHPKLSRLKELRLGDEFSEVEFCIPPASVVYNGRPAAWAFMPLELAEKLGPHKR